MLQDCIIHLGDCFSLIPNIPTGIIDAIITDPPYFTTRLSFDKEPELDWNYMFSEFQRILKPNGWFFMFGTLDMYKKASDYFTEYFTYIWVKTHFVFVTHKIKHPYKKHEYIFSFIQKNVNKSDLVFNKDELKTYGHSVYSCKPTPYKKNEWHDVYGFTGFEKKEIEPRDWRYGTTVLEFPNARNIGHPTAKPLALVETLVKGYTKENDLILDPFIGSGTTAVACKNLNRRYIGIEKNPDYVQIALNRLA